MGTNCSSCNCAHKESELYTEIEYSPTSNCKIQNTTEMSPAMSEKHREKIIKIQSFWRGFRDRKIAKVLRYKKIGISRYFSLEESPEMYHSPHSILDREERPAYKFKSGAVYIGQWRGTVRDGYGIQTWPDGARYEGQ